MREYHHGGDRGFYPVWTDHDSFKHFFFRQPEKTSDTRRVLLLNLRDILYDMAVFKSEFIEKYGRGTHATYLASLESRRDELEQRIET